MVMAASSGLSRALDCAQDAGMGAATAFEARERFTDLRIVRASILLEQRHRGHDPAIEAVAALRHLLFDERCLHFVRLGGAADAGERRDRLASNAVDRGNTGSGRLAVDQHCAGATLRKPTAK